MNCKIQINDLKTFDEIEGSWSQNDYVNLLELLNFPDAKSAKPQELRELLFMAINDFEPNEAATIVLSYKLSDFLNEGQIDQLSHEMQNDKVSEEYPEISLHYGLFNVNQLLYKAYNGKFPSAKATQLDFSLTISDGEEVEITKEIVVKALCNGFSDSNIIKRLFESQLNGEVEFPGAEHILWELKDHKNGTFSCITSEYWIAKDDITQSEFECEIKFFEAEE